MSPEFVLTDGATTFESMLVLGGTTVSRYGVSAVSLIIS